MTRLLDILIAAAGLIVPLAACSLVAAVAIKLESRGPVFYRQRRVGRGGARVRALEAAHDGRRAPRHGRRPLHRARATRASPARAALLRRFSLDELPNLVNVLRGEMSIVGPRPTVQEQVDRYTPHQRRRLEVKPGITGWAQVNGRLSLSWPERIELDVWYVDHRSLRLDLRILARTAELLATGHGLYSADLAPGLGTRAGSGAMAPAPAP